MTMMDSLAISVPTILSIFGIIISVLTYRLKKKDSSKKDTAEEAQKIKEEEEHRKEVELKLLAIEKDVQYIRLAVDKFEKRGDDHEARIQKLENTCKKMKGAK